MEVAEVMTRDVVSVQPETALADAANLMLARHISGLPVVDAQGAVVGMLTEGDVLFRSELDTQGKPMGWLAAFINPTKAATEFVRAHGRYVQELMTTNPICLAPEDDLADAVTLMHDKRIKRLPVVSQNRLVGILSRHDLLRALAARLSVPPALEPGETIESHIAHALQNEKWAQRLNVQIAVKGSAVTLNGTVFSDSDRQAVRVLAENTPGVTEVHDELIVIDPASGVPYPLY